jgi:hypothetical protein
MVGGVRNPSDRVLPLFDRYADVGSVGVGETDLDSESVPANLLAGNSEKLVAVYSGITVGHATNTRQVKAYFAGTLIHSQTAFATSAANGWRLSVEIVRVSATVVRYVCTFQRASSSGGSGQTYVSVGEITGLNLGAANILKATGIGVVNGDVTLKTATGRKEAAA